MGLHCHLKVVGNDDWQAQAWRLAFATSDRRHVDQHFGRADGFAIFAVDAAHAEFQEVVRFEGPKPSGHDADKLAAKIKSLNGCCTVYSEQVGASAIFQLKANGVQPIRVPHGVPISELIDAFQEQIADGSIERMLQTDKPERDADRFDTMADEEWQE